MPITHPSARTRPLVRHAAWLLLAAALVLVCTACGDDGGDGDGGDAGNGGGGGEVAAPAVADVETCLTDAGLAVDPTALTAEQQEVLGVEDGRQLSGTGDLVGIGTVTWHVDVDTATSADEANDAVRTDDVAHGTVGRVSYDYAAGDADQSAAVEEIILGCLE